MASVNIQGLGRVPVDDAFLSLSPEDQARTVDEIISMSAQEPQEPQEPLQASLTPGNGDLPPEPKTNGAPVPGEPDAPDIFGRISDRFEERGVQFREIMAAQEAGEQTFAETAVQVVGKVGAGSVLDIIGEGVTTAAKSAFELLESAAPDVVQGAVDAFGALADTDVVQGGIEAAGQGIEAYQAWARANPRASRTLDSVANLAVLLAPVKAKPTAGRPSGVLGRAAEGLELRATAQASRQRADFLDDLVSPKLTPSVRAERAARTADPTLARAGRVEPTASEAAIAEAVGDLPGVSAKNTIFKNLEAVNKGIAVEAERLERALAAQPNKISREVLIAEKKAMQKRLAESPLLVGDAAKVAKKVGAEAERQLQKHGSTGVGVLRARKGLDAWVKKQRPKVFDPASESALSVAVREVRQSMNNLIAGSTKDVKVLESLSRQSNLFRGAENIAAKAADQNVSKINDLAKTLGKAIGFKGTLTTSAAFVGLGAAPVVAGAAAIGVGAGVRALALSKGGKKFVAKLLRASDKAIRTVKDPTLLKQIRADRVAVIELAKELDNE